MTMRTSTLALMALTLLFHLSSSALAQEASWYQAEVIIFKRLSHNQTELAIDPRRLSLSYPEQQAFIVDQAFMLDEEQRLDFIAAANNPTVKEDNSSFSQFKSPSGNSQQGQASQPPTPANAAVQQKAGGDFYLQLERGQQLLSGQAKALSLSRNQRVLFHKSWNQLLGKKSAAPAIIINGGQAYDKHTELEGYIRLSKARYLHIDTNLWLSRFTPSLAGEMGNWPLLPEVPGHHRIVENFDVGADDNFRYQSGDQQQDIILPNADLNLDTRPNPEQLQEGLMAHDLAQQRNPGLTDGYHVEEIQNIHQSRRMRSSELHYIDHPAFGVIVQLIPIEAPKWPYNNQVKKVSAAEIDENLATKPKAAKE